MSSEIKIIATTVESFNSIQESLNSLPIQTLNRIETAEIGIAGITCVIKNKFLSDDTLYFPNNVHSIIPFTDGINVCCKDFVFVINEKFKNTKITYRFI